MKYLLVFFLSLALSLIFTPIIRKIMLKLGVLAMPTRDRWHQQPVALLGGIAIFVSFLLSVFLLVKINYEVAIILAGAVIMFILGLLDDRFGTHPRIKFFVQFLVASAVIYFGIVSKFLPHTWLNTFLTIFWIVGLSNAINMIDNMDGLSSGLTIIAALGIAGLSIEEGNANIMLLCLALAGSCLGFLRYNFKPAKIFMGDCGSLFLGYMLAVLAVRGGWQTNSSLLGTLFSPILLLSVVIFDTTLVTILRLKNHRKPWQGGKDHSSHRLVYLMKGKERVAVLFLYGVGIIACILGLIVAKFGSLIAVVITGGWTIALIFLGIKLSKVKCYGDGKRKIETKSQIISGGEI